MADLGGRAERTVDLFRRRRRDMSRRARCEVNTDIEPVAGDEPSRSGEKYGEGRVTSRRQRKQHAQRITLVEVSKPRHALTTAETDFGDTLRQ